MHQLQTADDGVTELMVPFYPEPQYCSTTSSPSARPLQSRNPSSPALLILRKRHLDDIPQSSSTVSWVVLRRCRRCRGPP
ncbi:hypothetical protein GQ55_8G059900 [Panicum hallii var. hallii]|uniref:Uncharacterized protein n=1 Tax=Panicum hallii var. hallii TaxID=1504633 RepID=A0A2T7CL44_9POAL|nr:hypothetical protein GQ55_8G059900 [Panicum hallii var. hallii]